jgi:N6-L-threonylcarbamoyladenine synthase
MTHAEPLEPLILGIESSCDETATSLVTREGRVRANGVASQVDLHARFGGVVPEVAARMHIEACLPLVQQVMDEAGAGWDRIEAIGATQGPGLIGCLLVGIETAKALAWLRRKPLIAVNHLAGHLYAINLAPLRGAHRLIEHGAEAAALPLEPEPGHAGIDASVPLRIGRPEYPHVGMVVSGGHTSLVWADAPDRFEPIAQTLDDAAGEAYDKVARAMGLGYPGGPIIDQLAAEGNADAFHITAPMMRRDKPDFSFSGLKTSVGREAERLKAEHGGTIPEPILKDLCAAFQRAAVEALLGKSLDALKAHKLQDLVISGGVACNRGLRRRAAELTARRKGVRVWFPNPSFCTDNAAMIAGLAWRLPALTPEEALDLNAQATMNLA